MTLIDLNCFSPFWAGLASPFLPADPTWAQDVAVLLTSVIALVPITGLGKEWVVKFDSGIMRVLMSLG